MISRAWISTKLLDFAESLPETKAGPFHYLQLVRSHQRRRIDQLTHRGSPPKGASLSLPLIRVLEAYSIENFDLLRLTLQRLFPGRAFQYPGQDRLSELDRSLRSLTASSWWRIGTLVRDRGKIASFLDLRSKSRLCPAMWTTSKLRSITFCRPWPSLVSMSILQTKRRTI